MNDKLTVFLGAIPHTNLFATPGVGIVCTHFVYETENREKNTHARTNNQKHCLIFGP